MSEAIRSSFREWNRMLVDQQQWDAKAERAGQDFELEKVELEQRGEQRALQAQEMKLSMEGQKQQQQLTQYKIQEEEEFRTPKVQSVFNVAGRDWIDNPEQREAMRDVFNHYGENVKFNRADGTVLVDGEPLAFSDQELEQMLPMIDRVRTGWQDTPQSAKARFTELKQGVKEMEALYKKQKNGPPNKQIASKSTFKALQTMKQDLKALEPMMGDDYALDYYAKRADDYWRDSMWAGINLGDKASAFLMERSNYFKEKESKLRTKMIGTKDDLKIKPVWDINPQSQTYGELIGNMAINDNDPNDAARLNKLGVSTKDPDGTRKDKGEELDATLSLDAGMSMIDDKYADQAKTIGGTFQAGDLYQKQETEKRIYQQIAMSPLANQIPEARAEWARAEADLIVESSENEYHSNVDFINGKSTQELLQMAETPNYAHFKQQVEKSGETLNHKNIREFLIMYAGEGFRSRLAGRVWTEYSLPGKVDPRFKNSLYIPNEKTRQAGRF